MPVAAAEKKRAKASIPSAQQFDPDASVLLESARYQRRVFEESLKVRAEADGNLTDDDFLLGRSCGLADEGIKSEFVRIKRLVALSKAAGSSGDRAKARARRNETAVRLVTRGEAIDNEINRLQQERQALAQAAAEALRDCGRREQSAVRIAEDGLPVGVCGEIRRRLAKVNQDLRDELKAVSRLATSLEPPRSDVLNLRIGGHSAVERYCDQHGLPPALDGRRQWLDGGRERVAEHLKSREAERQKLIARKAELQKQLDDQIAVERDELLDAYLRDGRLPDASEE